MVYFLLTDGRTVEGTQDCSCTVHGGPHWLHGNDQWKQANERLLDQGNVRGFIFADLPRVKEKRWYMESQHIVEIIRGGDTAMTPARECGAGKETRSKGPELTGIKAASPAETSPADLTPAQTAEEV